MKPGNGKRIEERIAIVVDPVILENHTLRSRSQAHGVLSKARPCIPVCHPTANLAEWGRRIEMRRRPMDEALQKRHGWAEILPAALTSRGHHLAPARPQLIWHKLSRALTERPGNLRK